MEAPSFVEFKKIPRLFRECVITEKLDGTNAQVFIDEDLNIFAGSRNRWLTIQNDNFGFARWVTENQDELLKLGIGRHFGEWWGQGIQRGYGLNERRFSLFNTSLWSDDTVRPKCCHVVPVLYQGPFSTLVVDEVVQGLRVYGSLAVEGWSRPEGVVVFHVKGNLLFKVTLEDDGVPKSSLEKC